MKKETYIFIQHTCFFLLLFLWTHPSNAQQKPGTFLDPREAEEHFAHQNYLAAIKVYKELLKRDPKDVEYNYKLGLCYLKTFINKSLAIPYLETAVKQEKTTTEIWFYLGKAYQYGNRFDDAIKAYTEYKKTAKGKDKEKAERQIETCYNGKELIKFPVDVTFENLGKEVNSEYADYYPLVPSDESFMIFTTRRKGSGPPEIDGYYPSDIFISPTVKNGQWVKPKNIGRPINTSLDEQAVGLSQDGKTMIVYIDHIDSLGNIYISENKKTFQKLIKLNQNINSGFETTGAISPDGEIIFFSSNRPGGYGETDIYMCRKLPNGHWALAQNLGTNVNTKYREDFPHLDVDGKTLYFSSEGHSSMGDFDLFKSVWDEENNTWSAPKNLGYPINTTDDDRSISFVQDDKAAYLSAMREGGFGDLDIYRVKFNKVERNYTIVTGYVSTGDTINRKIEATIMATDMKTNEEYTYVPIVNSGKYVMALKPGKYHVMIEADGYESIDDEILIFDIFQPEIKKDYLFKKKL